MAAEIDYSYYYKRWHNDSDDHQQTMNKYYSSFWPAEITPNARGIVLDIGCGSGLLLAFLKAAGYESATGIDTSPSQIASARSKGHDAVLVTDTTEWLTSSPLSPNVVTMFDVLEHVPPNEQMQLLRATYYAMAPGGNLVVTVPNANSALAGRWRYNDWTHCTSFTEHSLDFVLHNAGFHDIQIRPVEFSRRPRLPWILRKSVLQWWLFCGFRLFRRLEAIAELGYQQGRAIPLSLNIVATAKKQI